MISQAGRVLRLRVLAAQLVPMRARVPQLVAVCRRQLGRAEFAPLVRREETVEAPDLVHVLLLHARKNITRPRRIAGAESATCFAA